jgi:hypothetical protein
VFLSCEAARANELAGKYPNDQQEINAPIIIALTLEDDDQKNQRKLDTILIKLDKEFREKNSSSLTTSSSPKVEESNEYFNKETRRPRVAHFLDLMRWMYETA